MSRFNRRRAGAGQGADRLLRALEQLVAVGEHGLALGQEISVLRGGRVRDDLQAAGVGAQRGDDEAVRRDGVLGRRDPALGLPEGGDLRRRLTHRVRIEGGEIALDSGLSCRALPPGSARPAFDSATAAAPDTPAAAAVAAAGVAAGAPTLTAIASRAITLADPVRPTARMPGDASPPSGEPT